MSRKYNRENINGLSFLNMLRAMVSHWNLIQQMSKREILIRYKGSVLGVLWSVITPMVMLTIYTFIFSIVFKAKWAVSETQSKYEFAIILFAGLLTHGFFAEVINKAPNIITGNVNYVKKVVFPLEILSFVNLLFCLFNTLLNILVLLVAIFVINKSLPVTIIYLPLVFTPLILLSLGFSWILSSLGVYIRDISQGISIITAILTFLSPIFYPISAVPEVLRPWLMLNPLSFIIEQMRDILIWGKTPDFLGVLIYFICSSFIAWAGYVWFQKTRKGFADVL